MNRLRMWIIGAFLSWACAGISPAAEWFVATNGNVSAAGTNWATAKQTIQAAIDAAASNDTVWVSNGTYATGGRVIYGAQGNRVAIDRPITVKSAYGPEVTIIQGGDFEAVRCAYVGTNAILSGFTLTDGATRVDGDIDHERSGGGAWGEVSGILTNCLLVGNSASKWGGGSYGGVLKRCTIRGNTSDGGGGASYNILDNCTLIDNSANNGGGTFRSSLSNCLLVGNSANYGGGSCYGTLEYCTLTSNSASSYGGGSCWGTLNICVLTSNSAHYGGGGASGSTLSHCMLVGNSSQKGGGANGSALNNSTVCDNSASTQGGGAYEGILTDCELRGNVAAEKGGGAHGSTLTNCVLVGNSTPGHGGGASDAILIHCTVSSNSASQDGGGTHSGSLGWCLLSGNSAGGSGGGTYNGSLNQCELIRNAASFLGGGSCGGVSSNCLFEGNYAADSGGGIFGGTLTHCTLIDNSADSDGGGAYSSTLNNSIVYYNSSPGAPNHHFSTFRYCCTTPDPGGEGNITDEPVLASSSHLATGSPCIGAGSGIYSSGTDIDGESWLDPPSMGCDEVVVGAITGELRVAIWVSHTNVTIGTPISCRASISGRTTASAWRWGDGADASNQLAAAHTYSSNGVYEVVLVAFNESFPLGVTTSVIVRVAEQDTYYVDISNSTPESPFSTWKTAATNIQDAIDAVSKAGALVLVSNGVYATGVRMENGSLPNRVAITNAIQVRSVNGPEVTIIQGAGPNGDTAVRCAYLGYSAALSGFTLTGGATLTAGDLSREQSGGGAWCEDSGIVSHCLLTGNSANSGGGGSYGGTLNNCTVFGNSARIGGGVLRSLLTNCTVVGNLSSLIGGGSSSCTLNNSIVYGNESVYEPNWGTNLVCQYTCTTPDPGGIGNITGDPQFVDAAAGNYRLLATSPCLDAGNNGFTQGGTDLDGNPRIAYGAVDMGAYEAQLVGAGTWYAAITNGLTNDTDCAAGDGVPNLLKYATGSSPRISDDVMLVEWVLNDGIPTLVFHRNPHATDIALRVEAADEMSDDAFWRGVATNLNGFWGGAANVSEIGTGFAFVCTIVDPEPVRTNRFLRLRVTRP